jgi:hypothetical protein
MLQKFDQVPAEWKFVLGTSDNFDVQTGSIRCLVPATARTQQHRPRQTLISRAPNDTTFLGRFPQLSRQLSIRPSPEIPLDSPYDIASYSADSSS